MSVYSLLLLSLLCSVWEPSRTSKLHRLGGRRGVVTRVTYQEPVEERVVVHQVHHVRGRRKKIIRRIRPVARPAVTVPLGPDRVRPVAVVPAEAVHPIAGFEGSYVAVSGTPGRGSVHVVENVPGLGSDSVVVVNGVQVRTRGRADTALVPVQPVPPPVPHPAVVQPVPVQPVAVPVQPAIVPVQGPPQLPAARPVTGDRLPLPKCSYINTDFPGDDLILDDYTEPGINAGSARACKARCRLEEACSFWTYKEGFSRDTVTLDCFLKEGTPGLPVPREAVPRLGFVSGTQDNNCVCIKSEDEEDEVCPIKDPRGLVYPWRSLDEEENDLEAGLPPLGWNRGVYGAIDPRLGPVLGEDSGLQASVRALQDQLDVLARRLGGGRRGPVRDL